MQPGSLIFLVIVAVWLVYLVQHWIRRREHVATARSVDRFSEAMRVLERRKPLPVTRTAEPHPYSYVVRPSAARPALVVKRAPSVVRRAGSDGGETATPARRPARVVAGLLVISFLVALATTTILSFLAILSGLSVVIASAGLLVSLAALRVATVRDQNARRAARVEARRRGQLDRVAEDRVPSASRTVRARGPVEVHTTPYYASTTSGQAEPKPVEPVEPATALGSDGQVLLDNEVEQQLPLQVEQELPLQVEAPAARRTDDVFDGRTDGPSWSPVPVPPPTYTLKDVVQRATPAPADVTPVPVPIEVEDDELERLMAARQLRIG